jgi:hypothetical protein
VDETLNKINEVLKKFNSTFEISTAGISEENGEEITGALKITNLKNDGSEFVAELFNIFDAIAQSVSDDYELVYNEERGLVLGKKVVTVNYVFDDE